MWMQKEIIVYHQPNCGPCHAAMDYLRKKGVPFVAKDVFADEAAQRELTALGSTSTPTIKVGNEVLIGFSPSKLSKLLQD
jgi:glutaredoxin-like protein NrdH